MTTQAFHLSLSPGGWLAVHATLFIKVGPIPGPYQVVPTEPGT